MENQSDRPVAPRRIDYVLRMARSHMILLEPYNTTTYRFWTRHNSRSQVSIRVAQGCGAFP